MKIKMQEKQHLKFKMALERCALYPPGEMYLAGVHFWVQFLVFILWKERNRCDLILLSEPFSFIEI